MAKKIVFTVLIFAAVGVVVFFLTQPKKSVNVSVIKPTVTPKEELVDYKAGFAIFTHGTFRGFTAAMYHNLSQNVYIQAGDPNIVHIKKSETTWDDFFKTLPFKLTKECLTTGAGETFCSGQDGTLKFYLNGVKDPSLLDKTINAGDQALISFGNEDESRIKRD